MIKLLKKLFRRKHSYLVIRKYTIKAYSINEAITQAHFGKHDKITVFKDGRLML